MTDSYLQNFIKAQDEAANAEDLDEKVIQLAEEKIADNNHNELARLVRVQKDAEVFWASTTRACVPAYIIIDYPPT